MLYKTAFESTFMPSNTTGSMLNDSKLVQIQQSKCSSSIPDYAISKGAELY